MSLKAFHLLFISAATLLAFGFGIWAIHAHASRGDVSSLFLGVLSLLSGVVLIVYGFKIRRKLNHVSDI